MRPSNGKDDGETDCQDRQQALHDVGAQTRRSISWHRKVISRMRVMVLWRKGWTASVPTRQDKRNDAIVTRQARTITYEFGQLVLVACLMDDGQKFDDITKSFHYDSRSEFPGVHTEQASEVDELGCSPQYIQNLQTALALASCSWNSFKDALSANSISFFSFVSVSSTTTI